MTRLRIEPVDDVSFDGGVEELRLLRNKRHMMTVVVDIKVVYADAIDQNVPGINIVKSLKKSNDRRLATPRASDEGCGCSGWHRE